MKYGFLGYLNITISWHISAAVRYVNNLPIIEMVLP